MVVVQVATLTKKGIPVVFATAVPTIVLLGNVMGSLFPV